MNLKEIKIIGIDGKCQTIKFDYKGLANYIFSKTQDIGELELARKLYKTGKVELDKEQAQALKNYIDQAFGAIVKESLFPKLNNIINQ